MARKNIITDALEAAIYPGLRRLAHRSPKHTPTPDLEPGPMHWKPLDQYTDGAACGAVGRFTGDPAEAECLDCLRVAAARPASGVGLE